MIVKFVAHMIYHLCCFSCLLYSKIHSFTWLSLVIVATTDLFGVGGLLHHYRSRDILRELFFCPSKNHSFIYTLLFENLNGRILKSIITWSEMGLQTVQSKKIYSNPDMHVPQNPKFVVIYGFSFG